MLFSVTYCVRVLPTYCLARFHSITLYAGLDNDRDGTSILLVYSLGQPKRLS